MDFEIPSQSPKNKGVIQKKKSSRGVPNLPKRKGFARQQPLGIAKTTKKGIEEDAVC